MKTEVRDLITTSLDFIEKAKNGETNLEHAKLECTSRLRRALQLISGEGDGARYKDLNARVSAMLAAVPDLRAIFWGAGENPTYPNILHPTIAFKILFH